jgi:hypothetical protein
MSDNNNSNFSFLSSVSSIYNNFVPVIIHDAYFSPPILSQENDLIYKWNIIDFVSINSPLSGTIKQVTFNVSYGPVRSVVSVDLLKDSLSGDNVLELWDSYIPLEQVNKTKIFEWIEKVKGSNFVLEIESDLLNSYENQKYKIDHQKFISSLNSD